MKYILRTLWVIGFIPMFLLALVSIFVYSMVVFPIVAAFVFIKTGTLDNDNILLPSASTEWFLDKYYGLLDRIK